MTHQQDLINSWMNGTITSDQIRELEVELSNDENLAKDFVFRVMMHRQLRDAHLTEAKLPPIVTDLEKTWRRRSQQWVLGWGVGVALLLVGAILGSRSISNRPDWSWRAVASVEAKSTTAEFAKTLNGKIYPGSRLQFDQGQVVLRFGEDAVVTLTGNVDFEIHSAKRCSLHRGQVTATVNDSGRGFTITTPTTDVVDLGTEFGVSVGPDRQADVVVFKGEVDIGGGNNQVSSNKAGENWRLQTGEAMRIEEQGGKNRIPAIWNYSSTSNSSLKWSTSNLRSSESLISSVRDNLSTAARPKYYLINLGGFVDRAKCYVDRSYVWTGLAGRLLPVELQGGDYLQTFNNDKVQKDLEVYLEISEAAHVYVLFDQRIASPAWLEAGFNRTELAVSLTGNVKEHLQALSLPQQLKTRHQEKSNEIRPTETMEYEYPFTVWRRKINDPGEVYLGPMSGEINSAMYGVVVKRQHSGRSN